MHTQGSIQWKTKYTKYNSFYEEIITKILTRTSDQDGMGTDSRSYPKELFKDKNAQHHGLHYIVHQTMLDSDSWTGRTGEGVAVAKIPV